MTTLEQGAATFAKAHPLTPDGTSWKGGCARLMWDFCQSITRGWATHGDVSTAKLAMGNSNVFFPINAKDIRPGRFVWLSLPSNPDWHVGFCVAGAGLDALIFWATDVLQIKLGNYIGFGTVREYESSAHQGKFVGVSEDYAGATPNLSAFEVVNPPTPIHEESDMIFIQRTDTKQIAARDSGVFVPLTAASLARYTRQYGAAVIAAALQVTAADWTNIQADAVAERPPTATVDAAALAKAVSADIVMPAGLTAAQEQATLTAMEAAIIAKIPTKITSALS